MAQRPEMANISDEDLRAALREIRTYVDVTEEDLMAIYSIALKHARDRLASKISVSDVMTRDVIAVRRDADIHEVIRLLSENKVSGLPVIDGENHVIGIVTEADILHMMGIKGENRFKDILRHLLGEPLPKRRAGDKGGTPKSQRLFGDPGKVDNFMVSPPITTRPDADIRLVASIMAQRRIKRLPVVDDENKLIGIISRADIVRLVGS